MTEQQLREQLRKISALYEGATTPGERSAAAAAIERVKKAIAAIAHTEPLSEYQFTLPDLWQRRLFWRSAGATVWNRFAISANAIRRWWCGLPRRLWTARSGRNIGSSETRWIAT